MGVYRDEKNRKRETYKDNFGEMLFIRKLKLTTISMGVYRADKKIENLEVFKIFSMKDRFLYNCFDKTIVQLQSISKCTFIFNYIFWFFIRR